jgi:hypothetical protein
MQVSDYFSKKSVCEIERNLAADEATFAYHVCMHNQSFRSMDCTLKIIRKRYDKKFTCRQKKTRGIIVSVLALYAMTVFRNEFEKANYVTCSFIIGKFYIDVRYDAFYILYLYGSMLSAAALTVYT